MSLPTFLIIGAMKAGTSSLHNYLSLHPSLFMSKEKELNFFNTTLNWSKGVDWYKQHFDGNYDVRGETSPNYTKWEGTAKRVHSVLPNIKLIYVLRDPVKRFESQCNHIQSDPNQLVNDLKKSIKSEIFTNGLYHKWYSEYLKFYPKETILLLSSEDLRQSKKDTLIRVFKFLGVDETDYNFEHKKIKTEIHLTSNKKIASDSAKKLNSTKAFDIIKKSISPVIPLLKPIWNRLFYKKRIIRKLTPDNRAYLYSQYKADLKKLRTATGTDFYNEVT